MTWFEETSEESAQRGLAYEMKRALVWLCLAAVVVAVSTIILLGREVFMLLFLGILFGVCLAGLTRWVCEKTSLRRGWSLGIVCTIIFVLFGGGLGLLGRQIGKQAAEITDRLPESVEQVKGYLANFPLGKKLVNPQGAVQEVAQKQMQQLPQRAPHVMRVALNAIGGVVMIIFLGIFFAATPKVYQAGVIRLFPQKARKRAGEVMDALGVTLQKWLLGLAISMAAAAVMTAVALWILKIPMALAFGLLAGLGELVPNFGPIAAAVPAVMIALLDSPNKALYLIGAYVVIQTLQSYLITPLVQDKAIHIPPAVQIITVVLFGVVLGPLGLLVATPFVAVIMILVKLLYVHDKLGEPVKEDPASP